MKNRFDRMVLRYNNTLGDIQSGLMKLIPISAIKKTRLDRASNEPTKDMHVMNGMEYPHENIDSKTAMEIKQKRKGRSRNNSVKVVNRNQAKSMSSLQALRGANIPRSSTSVSSSSSGDTRRTSDNSNGARSLSPCLETEILPYTLTVDFTTLRRENLYTRNPTSYGQVLNSRKVRFN